MSLLSPDKVWTRCMHTLTYLEIAASQKRSMKFSVFHEKSASAYTWCRGLNRRYGSLGRQYDGLLSFMEYPSVTNTAQKVFELQIVQVVRSASGLSSKYSSHIESRENVEKIWCAVMAIPGWGWGSSSPVSPSQGMGPRSGQKLVWLSPPGWQRTWPIPAVPQTRRNVMGIWLHFFIFPLGHSKL